MTARAGRWPLLCLGGALAGCAPQLYDGPKRSRDDTALIETDGTFITAVDGKHRGAYDDAAVLPGLRAVSFRLDDKRIVSGSNASLWATSRRSQTVCFIAKPGRAYTARPSYSNGAWRPEIVDQATAEVIDAVADDERGCDGGAGDYSKKRQLPIPSVIPFYVPAH